MAFGARICGAPAPQSPGITGLKISVLATWREDSEGDTPIAKLRRSRARGCGDLVGRIPVAVSMGRAMAFYGPIKGDGPCREVV